MRPTSGGGGFRRLFMHADESPMRFYMPPSADRERIKDLVEKGDGVIAEL